MAFPTLPQLQAKWVFGNVPSDPLHWCKATLWSRSHSEDGETFGEGGHTEVEVLLGGSLPLKWEK